VRGFNLTLALPDILPFCCANRRCRAGTNAVNTCEAFGLNSLMTLSEDADQETHSGRYEQGKGCEIQAPVRRYPVLPPLRPHGPDSPPEE
jgi:hypothetical protein